MHKRQQMRVEPYIPLTVERFLRVFAPVNRNEYLHRLLRVHCSRPEPAHVQR